MLLRERYRGNISREDSGANMSYYLYINDFNYMISPSHYWLDSLARVISIAIDGKIDGPSVDDIGGVLRYLHGLCF